MSEHPFMAMLRRQAEEETSAESPALPVWEAQLDTLRSLARATEANDRLFERGQIVRYIAPMGPLKNAADLCLMYWRALDAACLDDQMRIHNLDGVVLSHLDEVDCVVAIFDGTSVVFQVSSTALLEPDPRADRKRRAA